MPRTRAELMVTLRRARASGWHVQWNIALATLVAQGWVRTDEYQLRDLGSGGWVSPERSRQKLRQIARRHGITVMTSDPEEPSDVPRS